VQDASSKQQTKKVQTQSSADRITTSLNLAHQRTNKQTNKKLSTNWKAKLKQGVNWGIN